MPIYFGDAIIATFVYRDCLSHRQKSLFAFEAGRFKAVVMDVDGTLYRQSSVRRKMLWRLMRTHVCQPTQGFSTLRVLRAYRKAQEVLRGVPRDSEPDLARAQLRLACEWTGVKPDVVNSYVTRWMEREPLEILARSLHEGLVTFLQNVRSKGLRLGALSDYPAEAKLAAMRIAHFFDVVVSAQNTDVQKLKPDPRSLEFTLQRLGVERHEALYIGDRPEVDAAAASNAGVACVIIGCRRDLAEWQGCVGVSGYEELNRAISHYSA